MQTFTSAEIGAAVCEFLELQVLSDGVAVTLDTALDSLGVDSFAIVEVVLFLERRFGIVMPLESLTPANIRSVETLAACCMDALPKNVA